MGRLQQALAAGRLAVAQAARDDPGMVGAPVALLVPGLAGAGLTRALAAFRAATLQAPGRVVIADHLPAELAGSRAQDVPGFEHLMPLADLLSAADPAAVAAHLARRVEIILTRREVTLCLWAGTEAQAIVQTLAASAAARAQQGSAPPDRTVPAGQSWHPAHRIYKPLAFGD